jgi:hypothetical protein
LAKIGKKIFFVPQAQPPNRAPRPEAWPHRPLGLAKKIDQGYRPPQESGAKLAIWLLNENSWSLLLKYFVIK